MLAKFLELWRIGVVEPIIVHRPALWARPIPTPRQGHIRMHSGTVLTAEGPVGMPVDRSAWAFLGACFGLMYSCFKRGIK